MGVAVFVCVNKSDYCGRGAEYVNTLYDSVMRNLPIEDRRPNSRFVCFTDNNDGLHHGIETRPLPEDIDGWWNKLWLFKKGHFEDGDRVIFLDLDTLIISNLEDLVNLEVDFAILRDFFRPDGYGSGIMCWKANLPNFWEIWDGNGRPQPPGGDQAFIESICPGAKLLQDLLPGMIASYKVERGRLPEKASIVCFHGTPKPHDVTHGWVRNIWRVGGQSRAHLKVVCNTDAEKIWDNARINANRDTPVFSPQKYGDKCCIVGGSPSLADSLPYIKNRQMQGEFIYALNGAYKFLLDHGIVADGMIFSDARPENLPFFSDTRRETTFYVASTCAPEIFDALKDRNVVMFHLGLDGMEEFLAKEVKEWKPTITLPSPGGTVGMTALYLAQFLGHKRIALYGMDSCYVDGRDHAYRQDLNAGERVIDVFCDDRRFRCAPWMSDQANGFASVLPELLESGLEIDVAGDGLLAEIVRRMCRDPDVERPVFAVVDDLLWPAADRNAYEVLRQESGCIDEIVTNYAKQRRVAVQAGGNCGLWPMKLAKYFEAVYTYEPDYINFSCLDHNCRGLANVVKLQAFVGVHKVLSGMTIGTENCGAGYKFGAGPLPTLRIDELGLTDCSLIMLDIEGMEYEALLGAERTIRSFKPLIVCEEKGHGMRFGVKPNMISDFLTGLGYTFVARYGRDNVYQPRET